MHFFAGSAAIPAEDEDSEMIKISFHPDGGIQERDERIGSVGFRRDRGTGNESAGFMLLGSGARIFSGY